MKKYIFLIFSVVIIFIIFLKSISLGSKDTTCEYGDAPIYRFEKEFFEIKQDSFDIFFPKIKKKFPYFFADSTIDFKHEVFLDDTLIQVLDSVNKAFPNLLTFEETIQQGFCNYKKYFPDSNIEFFTFIDKSFDYRTPVVYADSKLFISLHLFLGSTHTFYNFLPDYIKYSHSAEFLPASCFITLAGHHIPYPDIHNFLETILHYSKAYLFAQKMLPNTPQHILFKCSEEQMQWCLDNESRIWSYMIEREYLFSSSIDLVDRFVNLAPFSKFGLPTDSNSPGSVGVWLGLQIWNAYMDNNNISLTEVLSETDYIKVLNSSSYKP